MKISVNQRLMEGLLHTGVKAIVAPIGRKSMVSSCPRSAFSNSCEGRYQYFVNFRWLLGEVIKSAWFEPGT